MATSLLSTCFPECWQRIWSDGDQALHAEGSDGATFFDLLLTLLRAAQHRCLWTAAFKGRLPPTTGQTVVVLDWDDTLLCTSFLRRRGLVVAGGAMSRQLRGLGRAVASLLRAAKALGSVLVVTSAEEGWVEHSSGLFLRDVRPLLEDVPVISARACGKAAALKDSAAWKTAAFLQLGRQLDPTQLVNLVSIGDSAGEMAAARALGRQFAQVFVKTVRLHTAPKPLELQDELDFVASILPHVASSASNIHITL